LNVDFGINEGQEYKIGKVYVWVLLVGRVNRGDEGEGVWLVGIIYIYKIKQ
jgi:hypothetical protein